jgi:hypothetical protein
MTSRCRHIGILLLLPALFACQSNKLEGPDSSSSLRSVHLALSVDTNNGGQTKADISKFTEMQDNPIFRGLTDIRVIPFADTVEVEPDSRAHNRQLDAPGFANLFTATSSYLYSSGIDAWIPTRTGSILLYGRAPGGGDDAASRHRYGSLVLSSGFSKSDPATLASSLGFYPERMFEETGTPSQARVISETLTKILLGKYKEVLVYYGTASDPDNPATVPNEWVRVNWNASVGDQTLRELYLQMTNEGAVLSGSGPLVEALLTSLYSILSNYESHNSNVYEVVKNGVVYEARKGPSPDAPKLEYKELYNGLRDVIKSYIESGVLDVDTAQPMIKVENGEVQFINEKVRLYPESLGLPSGCAVLRWTPAGFVIPQNGGVEGIAPMDRYCFPPALYYFANTTIRTSDKDNIQEGYESYSSWDEVLSDYKLGNMVTNNTKSIALVNPAKFGVGMISATVKATTSRLQDNDDLVETTVEAVGTNLPVTGFVVGRQYQQTFDFNPVYTDEGEYYVYDNDIPGVYLIKPQKDDQGEEEELVPIRTLSLQTPDNLDAYICLELMNNTGKIFRGADGRVLPGRKFYLVGKLELPSGPREFDSVVVKGHVTSVTCVIHSLAGAYNCVPDLGRSQLVLGVQTKVNWDLATPSTLLLE